MVFTRLVVESRGQSADNGETHFLLLECLDDG